MERDQAAWLAGRTVAEVWCCGDDYCDCTQPQIVELIPNVTAGYPAVHRRVVWAGRFTTMTFELSPSEVEARVYAPLRAACAEFGVPVPDSLPNVDSDE